MGGDEGPISFILDLDANEFQEAGEGALGIIKRIGASDSMDGLVEALEGTVEVLGAVAVAAGAFKVALDLTIEGEEVQRIQTQFELLAKQSKISGEALKSGMEGAAAGLIGTTDLLQLANKAMVTMGADAAQLPALLELARKASLVMGGDVKSNFEAITQAVETGNQKMLKRLGLQVDVTAAEQKFAAQIGVTAGELSQEGKNHAVLLAVLEKSKTAYASINTDQGRTVDLLTQAKVSFTELGEAISVTFSKTIGPTISLMVKDFAAFAGVVKQAALNLFGSDAEKAEIRVKALGTSIENTNSQIRFYKEIISKSGDANQIQSATKALAFQEEQLKKLTGQLDQVKAKQESTSKSAIKGSEDSAAADDAAAKKKYTNAQKVALDDDRFRRQMEAIQKQTDAELEKSVNSQDQIDAAMKARKVAREKSTEDAIKKIRDDANLQQAQKDKLIEAERKRADAQKLNDLRSDEKFKEQLNDDYLKNSSNMWQGFQRAAHNATQKADADLKNFGQQGANAMNYLQDAGKTTFAAIGTAIASNANVAQSASKAMEQALLGTLGKLAIEWGSYYLSKGIADLAGLNPQGVGETAGGGALVALGTALSVYSGASTSVSTGGGGGGGSASGSAAPGPPSAGAATAGGTQAAALQGQQQVQRTVSINIAGHYLNSQESQRTLMEIMRNETDATGFQYNKIGV